MAEFIHLIDDISTPVKLGWLAVLVWGAVQFLWYQRARVESDEIAVEPESGEGRWSLGRLLARFARTSADDAGMEPAGSGVLSIAPAMDTARSETPAGEADLGAAAGVALETLLETPYVTGSEHAGTPVGGAAPHRHLRSVPRPTPPSAFTFESSETT